ncbi:lipopolysaccharide biosynthesis protein [Pontibacter chinhatensis]|uniref:Membrane protein involved in the export of O-antigen and teichoic acid n=1 Tax=Pontibacter chinhatensis TaxID=1436961 RepID=A0A1I2WYR8_9BACT|nr:hypothetical protein [Pontibacter chinhatensis]SFH06415.1 Membrane protein involved in the export of O-antigen and teichoic acid [Pontibacter chinhatensis]
MYVFRLTKSLPIKSVANKFTTTWLKAILKVLGSQVLLQIIGFGTSILLVREMPKADYAMYTVLFSIQAMLNILSDSGIMIGFNAIGGKVWQNKTKFASLLRTVAYIRIRVTIIAFVFTSIYGTSVLLRQGASPLQTTLFVIGLLLIVFPEVYKSFTQQALLLRKEIGNVQIASVLYQGSRLFLIIAVFTLFEFGLTIYSVLGVTILSVWASALFILQKSKHIRDQSAELNSNYKSSLFRYLRLNWHNALFFSFQGQISIFLLGLLGTTSNLAEIGALSRFTIVYTVLLALVSNIIGPAFGRCQARANMISIYVLVLMSISAFTGLTLLLAYLFPFAFLWVLGEQYQHLSHELFLILVGCSISLAASAIFNLNSYKGWIAFTPVWEIPVNLISLTLGALLFDLSTLTGVISLSIVGASTNLVLYLANSVVGFKQAGVTVNNQGI